jgi:outer membrane protein OmpA-like peptidoglycan-associated protein
MAQNLVQNGSFESYFRCPSTFSTKPQDFTLPGWRSANRGTPDHFHQCSWGDNDVPFNWAGQTNAHSGAGFAGIYCWSNGGGNYREYIAADLEVPLVAGIRYRVEFFYKVSSYSVYCIDRVGAWLTDSLPDIQSDRVIKIDNALVSVSRPDISFEWSRAVFDVTARGGENTIVIGNFSDDASTLYRKIDERKGKSAMLTSSAYLFIDDVSVVPLDPMPVPVLTAAKIDTLIWNEDRPIIADETYILKNIQFEFDSYKLMADSFSELDKLARLLLDQPEWRVELAGHTDDQGSDAYNMELSQNRARTVSAYLAGRGVGAGRLSAVGYGKKFPIIPSAEEFARSLNRRVEVKFLR